MNPSPRQATTPDPRARRSGDVRADVAADDGVAHAARPLRHRGGRFSVRVVAAWEAVKGVLVLLAGGLATYLLRPDEDRSIDEIVGHFHLNPAGPTSHIFQRALERVGDTQLVLLAVGSLVYALLRFVEAYGLWTEKGWGWILGIVSAALYLPLEIRDMTHRITWIGVGVFVLNLAIVAVLWFNRPRRGAAA